MTGMNRIPAALSVLGGLCAVAATVQSMMPAFDTWQIEVVAAVLRGLSA